MFHGYVLRSSRTGRRYVGSCEDLDERLRRHNLGHSKATRHGIPWTLIHSERFRSRSEASIILLSISKGNKLSIAEILLFP